MGVWVEGEERKGRKLTLSPIEEKKGWGSWSALAGLCPITHRFLFRAL